MWECKEIPFSYVISEKQNLNQLTSCFPSISSHIFKLWNASEDPLSIYHNSYDHYQTQHSDLAILISSANRKNSESKVSWLNHDIDSRIYCFCQKMLERHTHNLPICNETGYQSRQAILLLADKPVSESGTPLLSLIHRFDWYVLRKNSPQFLRNTYVS